MSGPAWRPIEPELKTSTVIVCSPTISSPERRVMWTKDEPVLDSAGIVSLTRFLRVSPGTIAIGVWRSCFDDQPLGRPSSTLTFSAALPELTISNGRITSLPAWPLMGAAPGRSAICRTRLTSISIGTTRVEEPGDENRASAATRRPASALAGMPIVTPIRFLPDGEIERVRGPRIMKSPWGTISSSTSAE